MTDQDPYSYAGTTGRSAKFEKHGDQVVGKIISVQFQQQTDYVSKKPKFYDDGNPMMQRVITLQTDERDDEDDDGVRKVYSRGQMERAIGDACQRAGVRGLSDGGKLGVKFTSTAEPKERGLSGAKQFTAKYEPPVYVADASMRPDPDDEPF